MEAPMCFMQEHVIKKAESQVRNYLQTQSFLLIFIIEPKFFHPKYCSKKEILFTEITPDPYSWLAVGTWIFKSAKVQFPFHY